VEFVEPYKAGQVIKEKIWGTEIWHTDPFSENIPLLIKHINARDTLSVQVHPDDEYAARIERVRNGKTELWLVLECGSDSNIVYGFNKAVTKRELAERINGGTLTEVLNFVRVKRGDCIFLPAGTVHALGKEIKVLEIQQPCDITYRLYDWGRTDGSGRPRELHRDKAVEAVDYSAVLPEIKNVYDSSDRRLINIIDCKYFSCLYRSLEPGENHIYGEKGFKAITILNGKGSVHFDKGSITLEEGASCIIPEEYEGSVVAKSLDAMEYLVTMRQV